MIEDYLLPNTPKFVLNRYKRAAENIYKNDFGELITNVVVLDTETTGVSFSHDCLTQVAAARIDGGKIVDWFVSFVDPGREIPEDIQELTSITNEDVADAPMANEVIQELVKFVGNAKIVAHNAEFDRHFVTRIPEGESLKNNVWFDSLDLTRIVFPRIQSHRLQDIVKQFDGPAPSHRADVDVAATVFLYNLLLSGIMEMPDSLVNSLAELAEPSEWSLAYIFKFVGEIKEKNSTKRKNVSRETFNLHRDREAKIRRTWVEKEPVPLEDLGSLEERKMVPDLIVPEDETIIKFFAEGGPLSQVLDNYTEREEQLDLALAILENFRRKSVLVAEAGTGIGKSLAYLVVCAEIAKLNNIPIGISTKTNALLDQLTAKDLPALSQTYEEGVNFASLKGISHYPCLRKVDALLKEGAKTREYQGKEINSASALATILSFIEQSDYDDLDMLRMDFRALPKSFITCESSQCFKKKCPFYGRECFTHGARRKAQDAEIVVTNHSLLLTDFATGGSLLPDVTRWIVDEAHTFEDEARDIFVERIDENQIKEISEKISSVKESTCIFVRLKEKFNTPDVANLFYAILDKCIEKGDILAYDLINIAVNLHGFSTFDKTPKSSYEHEEFWVDDVIKESSVYKNQMQLCEKAKESTRLLIQRITDMVAFLEELDYLDREHAELKNLNLELGLLYSSLDVITGDNNDYYQSFELSRRKSKEPFAINAQAYNVGEMLQRYFYSDIESCVFTSATLQVDRSFETFEHNMGLAPGTDIFGPEQKEDPKDKLEGIDSQFHHLKTYEINLPSSYNFDANMTVFAPIDVAPPARPNSAENEQYIKDLENLICSATNALGGSMLVLFTSRSEMEKCYEVCAPWLQSKGLKVLCQKKGTSTKRIADEFLADESVSLFALKSFWEGFDAPGDTLRGIIIARLPFAKPTDPLYKEREMREAGKNVFMEYTVPQTIIEMRQAVGRLIRKPDDKGIVIIADSRINKAGYGKKILRSMPTEDVRQVKLKETIQSIDNF